MSLKEKFIQVITPGDDAHKTVAIDLNDKIDAYIDWYFRKGAKSTVRFLIDKIAVWYEFKYPDFEIDKFIPGNIQEQKKDFGLINENSDSKKLDYPNHFNTSVFVKSLRGKERCYLIDPIYPSRVRFNPDYGIAELHLDENGFVEDADCVTAYTKGVIKEDELTGFHVRDIVQLFKEKGIQLPENNELESAIKKADNHIKQREIVLDCAMYEIIERGGNRMGPRRALLFAKEFDRNIDIPIMYGVDYSDPDLRLFVNEYIKAGGSKVLRCYVDYFFRDSKNDRLDTVTVQDLLLTRSNNRSKFYTDEEDQLHQRLVNAISQPLKLERKLNPTTEHNQD